MRIQTQFLSQLKSDNPEDRVKGLESLLAIGNKGIDALSNNLKGGKQEADFLKSYWQYRDKKTPKILYGRTSFHQAAHKGYIDSVKLMLDSGLDINIKGKYDFTPLIV